MSQARCTAVVPFRCDAEGRRAANLAAVLRWLGGMPVEVLVAEQRSAGLPTVELAGEVRRIRITDDGPFAKAALCNAGVAAASGPVVALVDADMLVRPAAFLGCVARVRAGLDVLRPYGRLVELDAAASGHVHRTGELPEAGPGAPQDDRDGERIPVCGGLVVLSVEAYRRAGGMDESFAGWGGEDDALSIALARTGADRRILAAEPGYHLWHPRPVEQRYGHARYPDNAARVRWWSEATDADVAEAVAEGRRRLLTAGQLPLSGGTRNGLQLTPDM